MYKKELENGDFFYTNEALNVLTKQVRFDRMYKTSKTMRKDRKMQKINIVLKSIQDIRTFVNEVTLLDYEVDLEQGRYVVDAKSIMGIFALDTLSPITLVAYTENADAFFARIKDFKI